MKLYLVQHGQAVSEQVDPARPLTEQGRTEVCRMAEFIKALGLRAECIWHSGKTRAMQTAQLLSGAVKPDRGCLQHSGLGPNDDVEIIRDELKQIDQDIMIVGHLPFLSRLASLLLVAEPSAEVIAFRQAGIVCLERLVQQWQLQWLVIPQILS